MVYSITSKKHKLSRLAQKLRKSRSLLFGKHGDFVQAFNKWEVSYKIGEKIKITLIDNKHLLIFGFRNCPILDMGILYKIMEALLYLE